jgi:hypothetical protein
MGAPKHVPLVGRPSCIPVSLLSKDKTALVEVPSTPLSNNPAINAAIANIGIVHHEAQSQQALEDAPGPSKGIRNKPITKDLWADISKSVSFPDHPPAKLAEAADTGFICMDKLVKVVTPVQKTLELSECLPYNGQDWKWVARLANQGGPGYMVHTQAPAVEKWLTVEDAAGSVSTKPKPYHGRFRMPNAAHIAVLTHHSLTHVMCHPGMLEHHGWDQGLEGGIDWTLFGNQKVIMALVDYFKNSPAKSIGPTRNLTGVSSITSNICQLISYLIAMVSLFILKTASLVLLCHVHDSCQDRLVVGNCWPILTCTWQFILDVVVWC